MYGTEQKAVVDFSILCGANYQVGEHITEKAVQLYGLSWSYSMRVTTI